MKWELINSKKNKKSSKRSIAQKFPELKIIENKKNSIKFLTIKK